MQKTLLKRIGELEKQMKQQKKGEQSEYGIVEKIEQLLAQMGEMEKQQSMLCSKIDGVAQQQKANGAHFENIIKTKVPLHSTLEEQQKKMDNFIVTLKERTNELLNAVHPNIPQPIIVEKFFNPQQNCWDDNACHNDLKNVDSTKMIVDYQKSGNDDWHWRSVFAKHSILPSNYSTNIFYFEISVLNLKSTLFFGFAFKHKAKLYEPIHLNTGNYARVSNGNCWINGSRKGEAQYAYGCADTVGFGVHLSIRQYRRFVRRFVLFCRFSFPFISLASFADKIRKVLGPISSSVWTLSEGRNIQ